MSTLTGDNTTLIDEDPAALDDVRERAAQFHFGMSVDEVRAAVERGEIEPDGDRPVHLVLGVSRY